ncbi:UMP kinase [Patescibacteria group bacterium]|nr:UMP kinase [Patescibacteria group bacterium]
MKKTYVVSLGGSIIVPDEIDSPYLKKFRKFIIAEVKKGNRFIIITGGGRIARQYRNAARLIFSSITTEQLDWIGIYTTRTNAVFVKSLFGGLAHDEILLDPRKRMEIKKPIAIGAGYLPGHSTDYDAVCMAKTYGADTVINLSNVDYVYDRDPKKPGAKKITEITWTDFIRRFGAKWQPGLNAPFDPVASKLAKKYNFRVCVANGHDFSNLSKIFSGKKFKGTVIQN